MRANVIKKEGMKNKLLIKIRYIQLQQSFMLQLGKMCFFPLCVTKTWMTWVYIPELTLTVLNLLDVYHDVYLTSL